MNLQLHEPKPFPWLETHYLDPEQCSRLHGAKTAKGIEKLWRAYMKRLRAESSTQAQNVANELELCRSGTPCDSGICPKEGAAQNQWFRDEADRLFDGKRLVTFSTVQLTDPKSLPRSLADLDIEEQRRLLAQALDAAGLGSVPFFGAFDFSYNTYKDGSEGWSCHSTLFTYDRDPGTISQLLNRVIGKSDKVPVPVKTLLITKTPDRAFSYALKSVFLRRPAANSRVQKKGRLKTIIDTSDPLFPELATTLHRIGRANRIIVRNLNAPGI